MKPVYCGLLSKTHRAAITLYTECQKRNGNLIITVDWTLTLDYHKSKLPVELTTYSQEMDPVLQKWGFHAVPTGFNREYLVLHGRKRFLTCFPEDFITCCRVLNAARRCIIETGMGLIIDSIINVQDRPSNSF